MTPQRVLFLDDGFPGREAVLACLEGLAVSTGPEDGEADLIVAALGGTVTLDLLDRVSAPVILVVAVAETDEAVEAFKRGACDYVALAQVPERLAEAVRSAPHAGYLSRRALQSLREGVAMLDGDGRVRTVNPAWHATPSGASFFSYCAERWGQAAVDALRSLLNGEGSEFVREYSTVDTRGERRWYEVRAERLRGYEGALVTHREVEERRTQFWCWESEAILSQIGQALSQCFWITSPSCEVLYMGPGYEALTGHDRAVAFSPSQRLEMVHAEDRDRLIAARGRIPSGDYDLEFRIYRADGALRWLRTRGFPVRDAYGRVLRVAGVLEDVTERKAPGRTQVSSLRVGIAEDEPAIRSLVTRVLRRRGYDALELDPQAMDDLDRLDVLITDVFLPNQTGVQLAARLSERFSDLRVIYMSGYTPEALAALGLCPSPLLIKPFPPEHLVEAVVRATEQDYQRT